MRTTKGSTHLLGFKYPATKNYECRTNLQMDMVPREHRLNMYFEKENVLNIYYCILCMAAVRDAEDLKFWPSLHEAQVSFLGRTVLTLWLKFGSRRQV